MLTAGVSDMNRDQLRQIKREADRVLFSDGGKQWPIFRMRDPLYDDFWLFFERYLSLTSRMGNASNHKSGKLNLPPYHPRHKNPIIYDDEAKEIYDATGTARKDKVDIVRSALEAFLHFLHTQAWNTKSALYRVDGLYN